MSLVVDHKPLTELDRAVLVEPHGSVRAATAVQFRQEIAAIAKQHQRMVIDLSGVDYIDSSTAGFFLQLHDHFRKKQGQLALASLSPGVRTVIDSIGLTSFFTVCSSVSDAVQELSPD